MVGYRKTLDLDLTYFLMCIHCYADTLFCVYKISKEFIENYSISSPINLTSSKKKQQQQPHISKSSQPHFSYSNEAILTL
ncbi:uncharacterized protein SPAPADRAFT_63547 [Spathaspora passalidarum NRRL Y-27907]|uniref:Uncharacterized protein n=1 Tax=Spathaspora passalidarum (strain NRRL Y-27907 / 11-Y1) TaxID=619300 RepID=G3AVH0_SPAPN|nr:uncharacterized protein SPAPADRAFT_63547 [Spathaspora passalidarum NRRL Y-27907]EGW29919.1 hypothetical protein SPAPADRAFT_63547 [Spathaspora passalidarum NRRL Y-27907]